MRARTVALLAALVWTAAPAPAPAQGAATVAPAKPVFRAIDRVALTADARPLAKAGSNFRLYIVPAGTPEAITDVNAFALASEPVRASLYRLTLPPALPGRNEIRLMYVPQFQSAYAVAARAPVEIGPRAAGATLAHELTREAKELGAVRFEAKYRGQPFLLEAAFLRVETRTTGIDWATVIRGTYRGPRDYMAVYVGHLGTEYRQGDGPAEVLCLMDAEDKANVDRMAQLNPGDHVLLRGHATTWGSIHGRDAVIFDRCVFAK